MKMLTDDTFCRTCPSWSPAPTEATTAREDLLEQRL
jgi:hypothetical protein